MWIGDQLPRIYDAAITIHHHSKDKTSALRKQIIHDYAVELRNMWIKSFKDTDPETGKDRDHVISLTAVKNRLELLMKDYENKVIRSHTKASLRVRNRLWMEMTLPQPKAGRKREGVTNAALLDIGKDMHQLKSDSTEMKFYDDQKGLRRHLLSQEIDWQFENERDEIIKAQEIEDEALQEELSFIQEESNEIIPTSSNRALRESVLDRPIKIDQSTQANINITPEIRKTRNTTNEIKGTIAAVSSEAGVSVSKARVATQVVCEMLYGHHYQLEAAVQEPPNKKPRTAEDYEAYSKVLPSHKTISTYKHKQALMMEITAAKALMNKSSDTKIVLHYDTTSRSRIDGEWPSLILNINANDPSSKQMLPLRPLFFAYEDRTQIVALVHETLHRLAVAAGDSCSAKTLWTKIDALMTDAVSKNLQIEKGIAEKLDSDHIPYHLLCKSHTCERMDSDNLSTLTNMEAKLDLKELIIQREAALKSFLRQSKSVVEVALVALLKLVARDSDGLSVSLADEFDLILEEAGVHKSFSLYKEKRFTRLGYQAGAVVDCLQYFRKLLDQTHLNNLLVRACRIYLENDYIVSGLKALSNFTYNVTMPFLNCVERSDQQTLCEVLPKLCDDLKNCKLDTLVEYHVPWRHVNMPAQAPSSDLDRLLLSQMCKDAAIGVELQCSREYWDDKLEDPRATQIHLLSAENKTNLPTNNLNCERYLAKFGYLAAQSAKRSNRFFKAKRIKDDLMFFGVTQQEVDSSALGAMKALDIREESWTTDQKDLKRQRLKRLAEVKKRASEMIDNVLRKCKDHGGPLTSTDEVRALQSKGDSNLKSQLRLEMQFQKLTHQKDAVARPQLYKVNKMTDDELADNLSTLFDDTNQASDAVVFPTEDEVFNILRPDNKSNTPTSLSPPEAESEFINEYDLSYLRPGDPVAVVWDEEDGQSMQWYIGFYLDKNDDGTVRINHLKRSNNKCDETWEEPNAYDIQSTHEQQILPGLVDGVWDFDHRKAVFTLKNADEIASLFTKIAG